MTQDAGFAPKDLYSEDVHSDGDWLTEGVLWRRVCGWAIDAVLIGAMLAALWAVLFAFGVLTLGLGLPLLGLLPVAPFFYQVLFLASPLSASPGQLLMGLVVRRNADLGPPGGVQAVAFVVGFYLTLAAGVVWLAAALLTRRGRALHDLASGLVVVRRRALMAEDLTAAPGAWNMPAGFPHA